MINYSYYPFLKSGLKGEHIQEFDEQSILQAKDNIEKYSPTYILELDLPVWLISTIMLRCLNNNYVTRKFVANYGKSFEHRLFQDIYDKEIRLEVLDFFGIFNMGFTKIRDKEQYVKINMLDYLEIMEEGLSVSAPQFKLQNQIVHVGSIFIELQPFIYLLRIALEQRLIQKIKNMQLYTDNNLINNCVKDLCEKYPRFDKQQAPSKENIPYSIQSIINAAYRDHHLDHRSRIKLGIYLQRYNFDMDYILDVFKQLSDFDLRITTYQLKSLKRYIK